MGFSRRDDPSAGVTIHPSRYGWSRQSSVTGWSRLSSGHFLQRMRRSGAYRCLVQVEAGGVGADEDIGQEVTGDYHGSRGRCRASIEPCRD